MRWATRGRYIDRWQIRLKTILLPRLDGRGSDIVYWCQLTVPGLFAGGTAHYNTPEEAIDAAIEWGQRESRAAGRRGYR